jgi:hypothetical protein
VITIDDSTLHPRQHEVNNIKDYGFSGRTGHEAQPVRLRRARRLRQIYVRLRYYERALTYSRCALKDNPNMNGVGRNIDLIEHLLEQRRRQMI